MHEDFFCLRLYRIPFHRHQTTDKQEEKNEKSAYFDWQTLTAVLIHLVVFDVIHEIKDGQYPRQKEYGCSEAQIPDYRHGLQTMPRRGPTRNHRHAYLGELCLIDHELGARKKRADRRADQQRPKHSVNDQKNPVGFFS